MINIKNIALLIFITLIIGIVVINPVFALKKGDLAKSSIIENELHQKAKIELSSSFYQIYRITERLLRANKLDEYSWRIAVSTDKNLTKNAYIKDKNLIVLSSDLIDAYMGNISGLAFVISHEIALKTLKNSSKMEKYKEEHDTKTQEADNLPDKNNIARECYIMFSNKTVTSLSSCMEKIKNDQIGTIKANIDEDFRTKQNQIEFTTDKQALIYMAKAGFDVNAVTGVLNFTKSINSANSDADLLNGRMSNIKTVIKSSNLISLKKQGRINIANSRVLSYEKSTNGRSIRINSRYGSEENIDRALDRL